MEFSEIKDKIQLFTRSSLTLHSLAYLTQMQKDSQRFYPFWKTLVLLKWANIHTDDNWRRKPATVNDINDLLKQIESFETEAEFLTLKDHKNIQRFFRIIGYQQIELQEGFYNSVIDRQTILYRTLGSSSDKRMDIEAEFAKFAKIDLSSFFNYCIFTYICINKHIFDLKFEFSGKLDEDYFSLFSQQFSSTECRLFLELLTLKNPGDFENLHRLNNERLQLFETDFFLTKPFLRFQGKHYIIHNAVFNQTLKHFVYTFLKRTLPDTFPEEMGKRLEKYLMLGLQENKMKFKTEGELKRMYELKKVVDYLIDDKILIESKATELPPRSAVMRKKETMAGDLNCTIVKAYQQLLSTASRIGSTKDCWGIVVTYREMNLGFGVDAWEEFLKEPIGDFLKEESIDIAVLPPDRLIFITIEDWDLIMQVIKEGKFTLMEILVKAKEVATTTDMALKRSFMHQVLSENFKIQRLELEYLKEANKAIDILSRMEDFR